MTDTAAAPESAGPGEDFAALLEESFENNSSLERTVVKGTVVSVESDFALIDVGLKSEGRVPLKEFAPPGQPAELAVGDKVEVFVERYEDINGEVVLSREKARRRRSSDTGPTPRGRPGTRSSRWGRPGVAGAGRSRSAGG